MTNNIVRRKIEIRKALARYKQIVKKSSILEREQTINKIVEAKRMLKAVHNIDLGVELPGSPGNIIYEQPERPLPTMGKLRLILEEEFKKEKEIFDKDAHQSDNDLKRLALKEVVFDYYTDLPYDIDVPIADYVGCMTLRRDDQDVDKSDFDFAPNKDEIYRRWMEKLARYIRDGKLNEAEYDEAVERGTPQGGAFEKLLDRYRKEFMTKLWNDFADQEEDQWKIQSE